MPKLLIVIASTRPGCVGLPVGKWFAAHAKQQLKQVVTTLRMTPVVEAVNLPFVASFIRDDGSFEPNDVAIQAADAMLGELARYERALSTLREGALAGV